MSRAAWLALAVAGLLAAACAGGRIDRRDLPDQALAFVYRTEEEALRRLELLERGRGSGPPSRSGEMVARLEDVGGFLGLGPSREEQRAAMLGRLAFMDPRDGTVSVQSWALRGARPLDWSPDHRRLLFQSPRDGAPQIFEYDRSSGDVRRITRGPNVHPTACYGPDGHIAYEEVSVGGQRITGRIFVSGPGGASPRALTPGPLDSSPTWSPDGSVLVYAINERGRNSRIAAVPMSGDGKPRLIARGRHPVFTSDGAWVVYSAKTHRGFRLRRMRPDGSGNLPLGEAPEETHTPAVSPDGRFVVYRVEDRERERLRLRAFDGRGDRPLVLDGDGASPVWN